MITAPRPGFDGSLFIDGARGTLWLVIDGHRYQVDAEAAAAIFHEGVKPLDSPELLSGVPIGGGVRTGSRLVRGGPTSSIHLFAVDAPDNRLHRIGTWESFVDFGFAMDKVVTVPEGLLRSAPTGVELVGARDRIARRGHSMYLPLLEVLG